MKKEIIDLLNDIYGDCTVNGSHRYYVTISALEKIKSDAEIKILSLEVKHLSTQDVVGKAPASNKKRLYNIR